MRTNALPSSARKNSCVLHDVRPGAFDVRKRASLRQLCLGLKTLAAVEYDRGCDAPEKTPVRSISRAMETVSVVGVGEVGFELSAQRRETA